MKFLKIVVRSPNGRLKYTKDKSYSRTLYHAVYNMDIDSFRNTISIITVTLLNDKSWGGWRLLYPRYNADELTNYTRRAKSGLD